MPAVDVGYGDESSVYEYDMEGEAGTSILISDSGDYLDLDFSQGNFDVGVTAIGRIDMGTAGPSFCWAGRQALLAPFPGSETR